MKKYMNIHGKYPSDIEISLISKQLNLNKGIWCKKIVLYIDSYIKKTIQGIINHY